MLAPHLQGDTAQQVGVHTAQQRVGCDWGIQHGVEKDGCECWWYPHLKRGVASGWIAVSSGQGCVHLLVITQKLTCWG